MFSSATLGRRAGVELFLKCENFQKTGSFKTRGVLNRLSQLDAAGRERGVVTVSAGNHAQALAWGAGAMGLHATVVMPTVASPAKSGSSPRFLTVSTPHMPVPAMHAKSCGLPDASVSHGLPHSSVRTKLRT